MNVLEERAASAFMIKDSCSPKMDTACFSETSRNIYQTIWRHIPEDNNVHSQLLQEPQISHLSFIILFINDHKHNLLEVNGTEQGRKIISV
jgi:hypothetical protein